MFKNFLYVYQRVIWPAFFWFNGFVMFCPIIGGTAPKKALLTGNIFINHRDFGAPCFQANAFGACLNPCGFCHAKKKYSSPRPMTQFMCLWVPTCHSCGGHNGHHKIIISHWYRSTACHVIDHFPLKEFIKWDVKRNPGWMSWTYSRQNRARPWYIRQKSSKVSDQKMQCPLVARELGCKRAHIQEF